jgi:hypothetical protein
MLVRVSETPLFVVSNARQRGVSYQSKGGITSVKGGYHINRKGGHHISGKLLFLDKRWAVYLWISYALTVFAVFVPIELRFCIR